MTISPPGKPPGIITKPPSNRRLIIRLGQRQIEVRGLRFRGGLTQESYEHVFIEYLKNSKPGNIPSAIEIRQREHGIYQGDIWDPALSGPAHRIIIPQRYIDVWTIFYRALTDGKTESFDMKTFKTDLENNYWLSVDEGELQHILRRHPGISVARGQVSTVKRKANPEETIVQAIEDHGRSYVAERATRLLLKTPAERMFMPEDVRPGLHAKDIHTLTNITMSTISQVFERTHPRFIAVADGFRSPSHYWVTDAKVIDLIPMPSENPGNHKNRFRWSYVCFWLTLSRAENLHRWQNPSEIHRAMVNLSFLYGVAVIYNICKDQSLKQFIDLQALAGEKKCRLNRQAFSTWQTDLLSHGITKPFPDSETTLPVQI